MSRLFVVIPAAGHSRRMGEPKLLIDLGGKPVIVRLLDALLSSSDVHRIVVVVRRSDEGLLEILEEYSDDRVTVLTPEFDPPEMRDSVELALAALDLREDPRPDDSWALIPADHPLIAAETFQALCRSWKESSAEILKPSIHQQGGHPTFFRWSLADEVSNLPADQGLNAVVRADPERVEERISDAEELLFDLDTPEDLDRARQWWSRRGSPD
ncbi:MAG: NTP transferase domain-containing protein [Planctomycetaceae bacterium]|nr:NTP transferase domain-containing protein [Planctomycetaceae bacterium]